MTAQFHRHSGLELGARGQVRILSRSAVRVYFDARENVLVQRACGSIGAPELSLGFRVMYFCNWNFAREAEESHKEMRIVPSFQTTICKQKTSLKKRKVLSFLGDVAAGDLFRGLALPLMLVFVLCSALALPAAFVAQPLRLHP